MSAVPTLAPGESYADLLAERAAFEDFDPDGAAERGYGYVRLSPPAVDLGRTRVS
jgi:xylose isomerase